jgi:hypothetical protein
MPRPPSIAATCSGPAARRSLLLIALLGPLASAPRPARANGAFPESFQLVLPADRPDQIALATNFGLVISDDAGASWTWTCERLDTTDQGSLYTVTAPPLDRFLVISPSRGLAFSNDDSCTWARAGGTLGTLIATDVFPEPTTPMRVYAIAAPADGTAPSAVYASDDGGATFGAAIYTPPPGGLLMGVESARADPKTIYVAYYTPTPDVHPFLARTTDGGMTWTPLDVATTLGNNFFYLVAVDPVDPKVVTARVIAAGGESLATSRDGGETFQTAFTLDGGVLTSYARLDSGTILAGGVVLTKAHGFRSTDGGRTFQDWQVPHLRALGARGGKLYAAAKNYTDDWAVGVSTDEGLTFHGLMHYKDVKAIRACAQAACADNCDTQAGMQIWSPAVCAAAPEQTTA